MKPVVPYPRKRVEFQAYDARTPEVARHVSEIIRAAIPELTVEHVGSTAIPGCSGRGVIDLMILYNAAPLESVLVRLETMGFQWVQRNPVSADDWPKGMGGIYFDEELFRLHIHVQKSDDPTVSEKRAFRDKLCRDSSLREEYMALKRSILASGVDDPISYTSAKSGFVQRVLEK